MTEKRPLDKDDANKREFLDQAPPLGERKSFPPDRKRKMDLMVVRKDGEVKEVPSS